MPGALSPSSLRLLRLFGLAVAIGGGVWWWQGPPRDPAANGQRLSQLVFDPRIRERAYTIDPAILHGFGRAGVSWLAYEVAHGKRPFIQDRRLPFDKAPIWLRKRVPDRWGGLRSSGNLDQRVLAAMALGQLGPEAAPAFPALAGAINSDSEGDSELIKQATIALHKIGPASWPAVDQALVHGALIARLNLAQWMPVRLGGLGAQIPEAEAIRTIDTLLKACHDAEPRVRVEAANALGVCYSQRPEISHFDVAIAELNRLLGDTNDDVQTCAVATLGTFGTKAAPAIPKLIELLDSWNAQVRKNAAWSLSRADVDAKLSATRLRAMSKDQDEKDECRTFAMQALKTLGLSPGEDPAAAEISPAP